MIAASAIRLRRLALLSVVGVALGIMVGFALQQAVVFYNQHWFFSRAATNNEWRTRYWSKDATIGVITDNGVSSTAQQTLVKVANSQGLIAFKMFRFHYPHSYGTHEDAERYYFTAEIACLAKDDLAGLQKLGYVTDVTTLDLNIPSTSAVPVEQLSP